MAQPDEYCVALYDYEASGDDEIGFRKDDRMRIISKGPYEGWWTCELRGKQGLVPSNYVEMTAQQVSSHEIVLCVFCVSDMSLDPPPMRKKDA